MCIAHRVGHRWFLLLQDQEVGLNVRLIVRIEVLYGIIRKQQIFVFLNQMYSFKVTWYSETWTGTDIQSILIIYVMRAITMEGNNQLL